MIKNFVRRNDLVSTIKPPDDVIKALKILDSKLELHYDLDMVIGLEVLEHFKDPMIPLKQIAGMLCKGGRLIFSMPLKGGKHDIHPQHYTQWDYNSTIKRMIVFFKEVRFFKTELSEHRIEGVAIKC